MSAKKLVVRAPQLELAVDEDIFNTNPLEKFIRDHKKHMQFIGESIQYRRYDQLVFSAQTLKLNLSHCGFVKAYEVAAQIEFAARRKDLENISEQFAQLKTLIADINNNLNSQQ